MKDDKQDTKQDDIDTNCKDKQPSKEDKGGLYGKVGMSVKSANILVIICIVVFVLLIVLAIVTKK